MTTLATYTALQISGMISIVTIHVLLIGNQIPFSIQSNLYYYIYRASLYYLDIAGLFFSQTCSSLARVVQEMWFIIARISFGGNQCEYNVHNTLVQWVI